MLSAQVLDSGPDVAPLAHRKKIRIASTMLALTSVSIFHVLGFPIILATSWASVMARMSHVPAC
jgi:hypothetical protein